MNPRVLDGWWYAPWKKEYTAERYPAFAAVDGPERVRTRSRGASETWTDLMSGVWQAGPGHGQARVAAAIAGAAGQPVFGRLLGHGSDIAVRVGRRLLRRWGEPRGSISWCVTGSQANDRALRLATQLLVAEQGSAHAYSVEGAYHGELGLARAVSAGAVHDPSDGARVLAAPRCGRCPVGRRPTTCAAECLDPGLAALRGERAAVLMLEPVQLTTGCLVPPAAWTGRLASLRAEQGDRMLVVADAVACGMGRIGAFVPEMGIVPDLVVLGKALSGGTVPVAAVLMRPAVAARLAAAGVDELRFGSTYDGYPVGLAAVDAALSGFTVARARARAAALETALQEAISAVRLPGLAWATVAGAAAALHFEGDVEAAAFDRAARRARVLVHVDGPRALLLPPLAMPPGRVRAALMRVTLP